jgi:hypothetical protein
MGPVARRPVRGERAQRVQAAQAVSKPDHCDRHSNGVARKSSVVVVIWQILDAIAPDISRVVMGIVIFPRYNRQRLPAATIFSVRYYNIGSFVNHCLHTSF